MRRRIAEKLEALHRENGIHPLDFNCKHYTSCISGAVDKRKFTTGHGTWIGERYEKGDVPKLLFLSLDSGSAELDPHKRTMEASRRWNLQWLPGKGDKPKHWYRTQQFAWQIFNEYNRDFGASLDIGNVDWNYDFDPVTEIHKIKPFYAATNGAKCCMNNENRSQADEILFTNCRKYIFGELSILKPDILVTQGKQARTVVERMPNTNILYRKKVSEASSRQDDYHILEMSDGRQMVWIHHYHPNNYGAFKKNRDNYGVYAQKAIRDLNEARAVLKPKETPDEEGYRMPEPSKAEKKILTRARGPGICSKIADYYYNHTEYREGTGTQYVIDEIEKLCKKGILEVSIDDLSSIVARGRPEYEKRVIHVVRWGNREELLMKKGDSVEIRRL